MAAEAEAAREARAKVIAAEGEKKASQALREAADTISESPAALQLRYLQVWSKITQFTHSKCLKNKIISTENHKTLWYGLVFGIMKLAPSNTRLLWSFICNHKLGTNKPWTQVFDETVNILTISQLSQSIKCVFSDLELHIGREELYNNISVPHRPGHTSIS